MFKRFNENRKREPFILIPVILSWVFGLIIGLDIYLSNDYNFLCDLFTKWSTYLALFIWCLFWVPYFIIKEKDKNKKAKKC